MQKEVVEVDGKPVWFYRVEPGDQCRSFLKTRARVNGKRQVWVPGVEQEAELCHLTGAPIKPEDGAYMVLCNNALFPTCSVSAREADGIEGGKVAVARRLAASWEEAKKHHFWFM